MPMSDPRIDELVALIGDEIISRLGVGEAPSCGCSSTPSEPAAALSKGVSWRPPAEGVAALLEAALLRPEACEGDVGPFCREAVENGFRAVLTTPNLLAAAVRELRGSGVRTLAAIAFPHGSTITPVKRAETEAALLLGADEIDAVLNIASLRWDDPDASYAEIRGLAELAHSAGARLTVTIETALLSRDEKIRAAVLARLGGADAVKNAAGCNSGGPADAADIALLRRTLGDSAELKAAGGIRSYARAAELFAAGASAVVSAAAARIAREAPPGAV